jgi:hypothetical protein
MTGLINAICMIHSTPLHFALLQHQRANDSIGCQGDQPDDQYLYEKDSHIWEQSKDDLTTRMGRVHAHNKQCQLCFHKEKAKLQVQPEGNQFDFSEMSIFGKFDSFCRRTEKVFAGKLFCVSLCLVCVYGCLSNLACTTVFLTSLCTFKIEDMMELIEKWNALNPSKIEGLDSISVAFRSIVASIKRKPL